jgi:hypothetical protein
VRGAIPGPPRRRRPASQPGRTGDDGLDGPRRATVGPVLDPRRAPASASSQAPRGAPPTRKATTATARAKSAPRSDCRRCTGAVIFALLALSLARRGRRGTVERVLNVACALGSLTMNLLAADLTSPRSVTVWVLPSALYALASDRLIAVVRRWVLTTDPGAEVAPEGSAWRAFGGLVLWMLRLLFDPRGTVTGFRGWVLAVAPVAPGIRRTFADRCPARR